MNVLWYIIAGIIALFLLVLLIVFIAIFTPIGLIIDTPEKQYRLRFFGGNARYDKQAGIPGFFWKFFHLKGFIPLRELFKKKVKEEHETTKGDDPAKKEKKLEDSDRKSAGKAEANKVTPPLPEILKFLRQQKGLIRIILGKIARYLKQLVQSFKLVRLNGTFHVEDPAACSWYFAVLGPFSGEKISLLPNFYGDNYLYADAYVVPGDILLKTLRFIFTLPLLRIYKAYRYIKQISRERIPDKQSRIS